MPRRRRRHGIGLLLVVLLAVAGRAEARPNFVVVSLDTVRADAIAHMPALQGLAARGVDFVHALSAAPWTVPSHAALFTGRNPLELSCEPNKLDIMNDVPTLMTLLDDAGYEVSAITEMGVLTEKQGYARGTTHFWTGTRHTAIPHLKEWRRRKPETPWMLFVHTEGAHAPYAQVDLETPERLAELWPENWKKGWPPIYWELFRGRFPLTAVEAHWLRERYWATAAAADRELARLLNIIEPWRDETIVIVTSDHGEELGEHGWWIKHGHHLHDVLLRVPLVVAGPGVVHGEWPGIVGLLDVTPTVLDLAGVDPPAGLDGGSLRPALEGEQMQTRPVYSAGIQSNLGTQRTTHPRGAITLTRSPCAPKMKRGARPPDAVRRPRGKRGAGRRDRAPEADAAAPSR